MNLIETLSNNPKFFIDPSLDFDDEKKSLLVDFIDFCKSELEISGGFKVSVIGDRKKYGIVTTAYYQEDKKHAVIYGKGRLLVDIMRSIAHELTHKKQYEENRIKDANSDGKDGTPIENEANSKAGEIIRKFGRDNKKIYVI